MPDTRGTRSVLCWGAIVCMLGACEPAPPMPPPPGTGALEMAIQALPPTEAELSFQVAEVRLHSVAILGDVAPDPRTTQDDLAVDLLRSDQSVRFGAVPQGLYSRLRFDVVEVRLEGTYRGYDLRAQIAVDGPVDLRWPSGEEITSGGEARIALRVDGSGWLGGIDLESARENGDHIEINSEHAAQIAQLIASRVISSFTIVEPAPSGAAPQ